MSRIAPCFAQLQQVGRQALIPYITAGDPNPALTVPLMHALVGAGANIIELGVPFSDPMADGPVIQAACERALRHGVSLRKVLAMVREFRTQNDTTPVVLMGYLNPIEAMGYSAFADAAAQAGVDGVLTVDMPPAEGKDLLAALADHRLDPIFLLSPTTSVERISVIALAARGFLYYVSLKGVTGASHLVIDDVAQKLAQVRALSALPVGVGFGIRDAAAAAQVARMADAVIVGSVLVSRIGALAQAPERILIEVPALVAAMRTAMDQSVNPPKMQERMS